VPPVGDDGEQNVVAFLDPAGAGFDRRDPPREMLLLILESRTRAGRDQLTLPSANVRQFEMSA